MASAATAEPGDMSIIKETFKCGQFSENLQEQRDEILALQAILNTDDDEKLKVLSHVSEQNEGLFSLLITVSPKPTQDLVQIDVVLPAGQNQDIAAAASTEGLDPPLLAPNVQLNRSESGWHWCGSFSVKYLSPFYLLITLPPSYPSLEAPQFHLSCDWLTMDQMTSLSQALNTMWLAGFQMPVIYNWVSWLEESTLSHLGITNHLLLQPSLSKISEDDGEDEVRWEDDLGEVIARLIRFNQEQLDIEFCRTLQECHICYCEKPGEQFFRINDCQHHYCHDCMAEFCEMHVREGTVEALRCPDSECNTIIQPYIVQAVLGPEAYQRWETLLLQKTLDAMSDTVYCPRCTSLVIAEAEEGLNLARCPTCYFAFCTQCQRGWHQGQGCTTDEEELENIQKRRQTRMGKEEEKKYWELLRKAQEEMESRVLMKKKTKACPNCKIHVEKIGGCNKMTCPCGQFFCWICGKKIDGYNHFKTSCKLFLEVTQAAAHNMRQPVEAAIRIEARIAVNPELANNRIHCPTCKQMNLKGQDRNNHIKCWNCKGNFCFLCKQRIIGNIVAHFKGPCVQHS